MQSGSTGHKLHQFQPTSLWKTCFSKCIILGKSSILLSSIIGQCISNIIWSHNVHKFSKLIQNNIHPTASRSTCPDMHCFHSNSLSFSRSFLSLFLDFKFQQLLFSLNESKSATEKHSNLRLGSMFMAQTLYLTLSYSGSPFY